MISRYCPTCAGGRMAYDFPEGCPDCKDSDGKNQGRIAVLSDAELNILYWVTAWGHGVTQADGERISAAAKRELIHRGKWGAAGKEGGGG